MRLSASRQSGGLGSGVVFAAWRVLAQDSSSRGGLRTMGSGSSQFFAAVCNGLFELVS